MLFIQAAAGSLTGTMTSDKNIAGLPAAYFFNTRV
jgi:hypothetical protein